VACDPLQVLYYSTPDVLQCLTPSMPEGGSGTDDSSLFPVAVIVTPGTGQTQQATCGTYCYFRYRTEASPRVRASDREVRAGAPFRVFGPLVASSPGEYDIRIGGGICSPTDPFPAFENVYSAWQAAGCSVHHVPVH
jgi:hypothetical protein